MHAHNIHLISSTNVRRDFEFLIQAAYFAERFHIDCKNRKFDHHNITCNAISRQKGRQLQLALRLLKRYPELVWRDCYSFLHSSQEKRVDFRSLYSRCDYMRAQRETHAVNCLQSSLVTSIWNSKILKESFPCFYGFAYICKTKSYLLHSIVKQQQMASRHYHYGWVVFFKQAPHEFF